MEPIQTMTKYEEKHNNDDHVVNMKQSVTNITMNKYEEKHSSNHHVANMEPIQIITVMIM